MALVYSYVSPPDFGPAAAPPVPGELRFEPGGAVEVVALACRRRIGSGRQVPPIPSTGNDVVRGSGPFSCRAGGPADLDALPLAGRLRACLKVRPRRPSARVLRETARALSEGQTRGPEAQVAAAALEPSPRPALVLITVVDELIVPVHAPCVVRDCHMNPRRPVVGRRRSEDLWVASAGRSGAETLGRLAVPHIGSWSVPVPFVQPPVGPEVEALTALRRADLGAAARALAAAASSTPGRAEPAVRALLLAFVRAVVAARLDDRQGLEQALVEVQRGLADRQTVERVPGSPLRHWVDHLGAIQRGERLTKDPCARPLSGGAVGEPGPASAPAGASRAAAAAGPRPRS